MIYEFRENENIHEFLNRVDATKSTTSTTDLFKKYKKILVAFKAVEVTEYILENNTFLLIEYAENGFFIEISHLAFGHVNLQNNTFQPIKNGNVLCFVGLHKGLIISESMAEFSHILGTIN